jgi:HAD superfamily hydrolase (TIGR01509 family)
LGREAELGDFGPSPDLIIFDCDGVLIDSEAIACRIDAIELSAIGYTISEAELALRFSGVPYRDMYRTIETELGRPLPEGFADRVHELVAAACRTGVQPIAGIFEALDRITVPVCVASSSKPGYLQEHLSRLGLWRYFAPHVFSAAMVPRGKPAPDVFLHAARVMDVTPRRCLVIEDSIAGVEAGVAAGMTVLGFTGGGHSGPMMEARLLAAGAAAAYADHRALPQLIAEFGARYFRTSE